MRIFIFIFLFFACNVFIPGQIVTAEFDVNSDGQIDKIDKDTISNIYNFYYKTDNKEIFKKIVFFKNFNSTAATIEMKMSDIGIIYTIRYAPKYNDFDIIKFTYSKNKDDWFLKEFLTHRFNPLDKKLLTEECNIDICPKNKISLIKSSFESVQMLSKLKKKRNCKFFSEE